MPAKKRTAFQREKDLEKTSELYLKGHSQYEIARVIGVSRTQITYDIADLQKRWLDRSMMNLDERKAEELAKIDRLEAEYWKGWEDSRTEFSSKAVEAVDGKGKRKKVSQRTESRYGDPRFLIGVSQCIEQRCKILGLHAPTKLQGTFTHDHEYTDTEIKTIAAHLAGRKN